MFDLSEEDSAKFKLLAYGLYACGTALFAYSFYCDMLRAKDENRKSPYESEVERHLPDRVR